MNRMFVEQKENGEQSAAGQSSVAKDEEDPIPITMSYAMALNQFLAPGELPPRTIDDGSDRSFRRNRTDHEPDVDDNYGAMEQDE